MIGLGESDTDNRAESRSRKPSIRPDDVDISAATGALVTSPAGMT